MSRPRAQTITEPAELTTIRAQLLWLEIQDAINDQVRRRLQARRAQLLEQLEGIHVH